MKKAVFFLTIATAALSVPGLAGEIHEIVLDHGGATQNEVTARVGDTLMIIHNDDDGLHALYAEDPYHSFDLSDMAHGDHFDLTLTHAGTIDVYCHIMDDMHLVITVTE